ncbi:glycosyltransferase 87 family protein [Lentzea chajnantorensis]
MVGLAWVLALVGLLIRWHGHYPIDLDVYRLGGLAWLTGNPLYSGFTGPPLDPGLPFTYPPLAAVSFSAMSFVPGWALNPLLLTAGFVALTAVCVTVAGRVRPGLRWTLGPVAPIAALALDPVESTFGYGQINLLLLGLVVVDCLAVTDRRFRGALVGVAAAVKLTPLIFVLYFLVRRDWRAALTAAATSAGLAVVGFLVAPRDSVQFWFHAMVNPERISGVALQTNQSIQGLLRGLGLESGTRSLLWVVLSVVAVAAATFVAWRSDDDVVALFVIAAAGLLASPVSWLHHWVWCVPVLLLLALRGHWPTFVIVTAVFMIPVHEVDGYVALAAVALSVLAYRSRIVATPTTAAVKLSTG